MVSTPHRTAVLVSSVCPLVCKASPEACAGVLAGGTSGCPLTDGTRAFLCWHGRVRRCVYRRLWGQDSFMSADRWGCGSTLFIVRPEASQHWSLQALGGAQVVTSGELTQVNVLGASLTGFLGSSVSHRRRLPPLEKHPSSAVGSAVAPQECQCFALGLGVCNVSALPQNGDSVPHSLELPLTPHDLRGLLLLLTSDARLRGLTRGSERSSDWSGLLVGRRMPF